MQNFNSDSQERAFVFCSDQESSNRLQLLPLFKSGIISRHLNIEKITRKQLFFSNQHISNEGNDRNFSIKSNKNISKQVKNSRKIGPAQFSKTPYKSLEKKVKLKRNGLLSLPSGKLALQLWKVFLSIPSTAKKILHVAFGVQNKENRKELHNLAEGLPKFEKIISNHTQIQIEQAQDALRGEVAQQLSEMNQKQAIRQLCKMKRLSEFQSYLGTFIDEISKGPPCRRLTKARKECIKYSQSGQNSEIL